MLIAGYESHPAADAFPLMQGEPFVKFVDDVREHGLRQPIVLLDGQVVDGRNRLRACAEAEVEPRFEEYGGDESARGVLAYACSLNLLRRHLTTSQASVAAAKALVLYEAAARERQRGGQGGKLLCADLHKANWATAEAAKDFGVSRRSVDYAKKIVDHGDARVVKAIEDGSVTVGDAAKIVDRPKSEQRELLKKKLSGEFRTLAGAAKEADADAEAEGADEGEPTEPTEPSPPAPPAAPPAPAEPPPAPRPVSPQDTAILAAYDDSAVGGGSPTATARAVGVSASRVQGALRRHRPKPKKNSLEGATEVAASRAFGWTNLVEHRPWRDANDEEVEAFSSALQGACSALKNLIREVNKARSES